MVLGFCYILWLRVMFNKQNQRTSGFGGFLKELADNNKQGITNKLALRIDKMFVHLLTMSTL